MDPHTLFWLVVAVVTGAVEIYTVSLAFAMVSGGALVAAVAFLLTGSTAASVVAFALSTALLLAVVRPPLLRYVRRAGAEPTGTAALVGRPATVVLPVDDHAGEVKLAGEIWTARSLPPAGDPLEIGSTVYVVRIEGATALVSAVAPRTLDPADRPGGEPPTDRPEF